MASQLLALWVTVVSSSSMNNPSVSNVAVFFAPTTTYIAVRAGWSFFGIDAGRPPTHTFSRCVLLVETAQLYSFSPNVMPLCHYISISCLLLYLCDHIWWTDTQCSTSPVHFLVVVTVLPADRFFLVHCQWLSARMLCNFLSLIHRRVLLD
jgi:hypothetical protein